MPYAEEDFLALSGIQHFSFCRRQWALIHIEGQWEENWKTARGRVLHERAHDPYLTEKRKNRIVTHDMVVFSNVLGTSGKCDVVEFDRDDSQGVSLFGRAGKWTARPVEYKRGKPKTEECDRLQLAAQAMCLEEMLMCSRIERGCLYYNEIRRREEVDISEELRSNVVKMFAEMHSMFGRRHTPAGKSTRACASCSMREICLPKLAGMRSVSAYIDSAYEVDR